MLLAIDTATDTASLALHDGFQVRVEHTWESARRHTVELVPRLLAALEQVGLGAEHLSGVAVTRGPGSFTGLRVGIAVAKGLALARGLPLVGVPTLGVIVAEGEMLAEAPLIALSPVTLRVTADWKLPSGSILTVTVPEPPRGTSTFMGLV